VVVLFDHFLESVEKILREEVIKGKKTGIEVEVESAEELSRILKLANEEKQRVKLSAHLLH